MTPEMEKIIETDFLGFHKYLTSLGFTELTADRHEESCVLLGYSGSIWLQVDVFK